MDFVLINELDEKIGGIAKNCKVNIVEENFSVTVARFYSDEIKSIKEPQVILPEPFS